MTVRLTAFENSTQVGVFAKLTNAYCITALGNAQNFHSVFQQMCGKSIPCIQATIGSTRLVGRLTAGNKNGILVPTITTDQELQHLRNSLPDAVVVQRIHERLSALGNCICCNDYVALVNPDIDKETEEIIEDVLGVEVFRTSIAGLTLTGTYCAITNRGGLAHAMTTHEELEELSQLVEVPFTAGTVNRGSMCIGGGLTVNDWMTVCGADTTSTELSVVQKIFDIKSPDSQPVSQDQIQKVLIESFI